MAAIHSQYKRRYGRPRILRELGQPVDHERVRKSLQHQGLRPLYRRPYRVTTDIMDLASRRIVGWSMSDRIKADLACQAFKSAYWQRQPPPGLIMHTDRGSQYAGDQYCALIKDFRT